MNGFSDLWFEISQEVREELIVYRRTLPVCNLGIWLDCCAANWANCKRRNQPLGFGGFLSSGPAAYHSKGPSRGRPSDPMLSFIGERIENGDVVIGAKQIIDPQ